MGHLRDSPVSPQHPHGFGPALGQEFLSGLYVRILTVMQQIFLLYFKSNSSIYFL
jgi:hypothetical protein